MSEAAEIARNMIGTDTPPDVKSIDEARAWVKAQWPDWDEWIGFVQLDNIAEAVFNEARRK